MMGMHVIGSAERVAVVQRQQPRGLAGWVLELWHSFRAQGVEGRRKQLRLIETLPVGGRKQLLLVSCGGERFLVGTGSDGVGTIVRVRPELAREAGAGASARAGDQR